jgi:hypothetical protein
MNNALRQALDLLQSGVLSIDDEGRIWRHAARIGGRIYPVEPRRAESTTRRGYLRVRLYVRGVGLQTVAAHHVVWVAANGPISEGLQINHKDMNPSNNRLDNLELVTPSGNMRHSYQHGRLTPFAYALRDGKSWFGRAIPTDAEIADMRAARRLGATLKEIAERFNVSITRACRLTIDARRELNDAALRVRKGAA